MVTQGCAMSLRAFLRNWLFAFDERESERICKAIRQTNPSIAAFRFRETVVQSHQAAAAPQQGCLEHSGQHRQ